MFIITTVETNVVVAFGEELHYLENGYPCLTQENIAFPTDMFSVSEAQSVPDDLAPEKYLYTVDNDFVPNPNYIPPDESNTYGIPDSVYHSIIDDYTFELVGGVE